MEYEPWHCCGVKLTLLLVNKIDELDGTNERLLKYYKENIEKHAEV